MGSLAVLILAAGALAGLAGCGDDDDTASSSATTGTPPSQSAAPTSVAAKPSVTQLPTQAASAYPVYKDARYGFQFGYPESCPVAPASVQDAALALKVGDGNLAVLVFDPAGLSLGDYVAGDIANRHLSPESKEQTSLGGKVATRVSYRTSGTNEFGQVTYTAANGYLFEVSFEASGVRMCDEPAALTGIINTMQFTPLTSPLASPG